MVQPINIKLCVEYIYIYLWLFADFFHLKIHSIRTYYKIIWLIRDFIYGFQYWYFTSFLNFVTLNKL